MFKPDKKRPRVDGAEILDNLRQRIHASTALPTPESYDRRYEGVECFGVEVGARSDYREYWLRDSGDYKAAAAVCVTPEHPFIGKLTPPFNICPKMIVRDVSFPADGFNYEVFLHRVPNFIRPSRRAPLEKFYQMIVPSTNARYNFVTGKRNRVTLLVHKDGGAINADIVVGGMFGGYRIMAPDGSIESLVPYAETAVPISIASNDEKLFRSSPEANMGALDLLCAGAWGVWAQVVGSTDAPLNLHFRAEDD